MIAYYAYWFILWILLWIFILLPGVILLPIEKLKLFFALLDLGLTQKGASFYKSFMIVFGLFSFNFGWVDASSLSTILLSTDPYDLLSSTMLSTSIIYILFNLESTEF